MYLLIKPYITAKSAKASKDNKYSFIVRKEASKLAIKREIAKEYKVNVEAVNTARYAGKQVTRYINNRSVQGKRGAYKKAVVTLQAGQTINVYQEIV